MLLNRSAHSFPPIELVTTRPVDVSTNADGYVRSGEARIYVVAVTAAFSRARGAAYKCGDLPAIRKIASVLIHEEWHVRHGSDETGAYLAQLTTLASLDAGPGNPLYAEVLRSLQATTRAGRLRMSK
jgi:hypothetical protein